MLKRMMSGRKRNNLIGMNKNLILLGGDGNYKSVIDVVASPSYYFLVILDIL